MARENLTQEEVMKELIGIAVVVATLFGGTIAAEKIFADVRKASLTKAAQGLPDLSAFTKVLTHKTKKSNHMAL